MVCRFLATFTAVLRIATALAVSVALLVPHISNAPRYDMAMAMVQAEGTMAERSHPGMSHGTFGGAACAVVCLGAPVTDSPGDANAGFAHHAGALFGFLGRATRRICP